MCKWGFHAQGKVHPLALGNVCIPNPPEQPKFRAALQTPPQRPLQHPPCCQAAGFCPVGTAVLGRSQRKVWFQTLESFLPRRGGEVINSLDSFSPTQAQIPHPRPSPSQLVPPRPSSHSLLQEGGKWHAHSRGGEQSPSGPRESEWPPMNCDYNPTTPLRPFVITVLKRGKGLATLSGGPLTPWSAQKPQVTCSEYVNAASKVTGLTFSPLSASVSPSVRGTRAEL